MNQAMRERLAAAWGEPDAVGYVVWNTHHLAYQARITEQKWRTYPPELIELNDAQFEKTIAEIRAVRALAWAYGVPKEIAA